MRVIWEYLDCGDLKNGFARIRCADCGHEYLLPFSCKRRHFCPSCHERRVLEFGEFLVSEVLADVPHRQWVFSIPKMLRPWFMRDRKLLGEMCAIVWKLLSRFIKAETDGDEATDAHPAAVMSIQTFGEQVNFNPHIHVICADGCFKGDGIFYEAWAHDTSPFQKAFADEIFKLLTKKGMSVSQVEMMCSWQHSGFSVYRSSQILAGDREGLERLASYIVRCPFTVSRMTYIKESGEVSYRGKTSGVAKPYSALDFLARLVIQIPSPHEQMVRYYGYYSNKSRGLRKKIDTDGDVKEVLPAKKLTSISWARLIAKVYLENPLICPRCKGQMRIIACIEEDAVIAKILRHRGLWELPVAHAPPPLEFARIAQMDNTPDDYSELLPSEYEYEAC
ncbi:MAG: transposase [Sphaerochaetaceae bacterium]